MPPKRSALAPTSINALLNHTDTDTESPEKPVAKSVSAPAPAPVPATSNKRKAAEIEEPEELSEIDDEDPRLQHVDLNCDQVRRRINNLINSGAMKVTEFQKAIGVSSKSYSGFMGRSGAYGGDNFAAYHNAWAFFKKRELRGIKEPKKKVAKTEENKALDLGGVQLEGESTQDVPVYESCEEVRKKIRAYLKQPNITQAGFLREAAKTLDGKKIQSKQLNEFLGKKGTMAGNTAAIYYAAYVFFEKIRIRDGKPKSKHRLEMEKIHKSGVERVRRLDGPVWVLKGEVPTEDEYGRLIINGRTLGP